MEFYGIKYEEYKSFNNCRPKSYQLDYNPYIQIVHTVKKDLYGIFIEITIETDLENNNIYKTVSTYLVHVQYLQPIITQYFIDNKSEIWLLFLIAHSKR